MRDITEHEEPTLPRLTIEKALIQTEREAFVEYVMAIGRTVGFAASAKEAREACPDEFAEWREAFANAYRRHV